jgi:hypothetical protein
MGDLLGSLIWGAKSGQYCVIGGGSLHLCSISDCFHCCLFLIPSFRFLFLLTHPFRASDRKLLEHWASRPWSGVDGPISPSSMVWSHRHFRHQLCCYWWLWCKQQKLVPMVSILPYIEKSLRVWLCWSAFLWWLVKSMVAGDCCKGWLSLWQVVVLFNRVRRNHWLVLLY